MAGRYDIVIYQGSTFELPLTLKNGDGTPFNLTSWIPRGQMRRHVRSTAIAATFTCTIIEPATNGQFTVSLSSAITAAIIAGDSVTDPRSLYVYDVEMENEVTGAVKRIIEGSAYIDPEVTRT